MGELHLYLKMNWEFVSVGQNLCGNLTSPSFGGGVGSDFPFWTVGTPNYGAFNAVAATNNAVNTLITTRSYPEGLKFCPFFQLQRLRITFTLGTDAPTALNFTVLNISINGDNTLTLTLSADIKAAGNNVGISAISCEGINAGTNAQIANLFNVREAELVVKSAVKSSKKQAYEYLVYDLEKDSSNQNTHKRTYEVPAGCVGVAVLFPSDTGRLSSLSGISGREVKISINTDDVNQGHVMRYGDSLERDLKERFFKNLGYQQVRNLQNYTGSRSGSELGSEGVYLPIPESDMVQTLTLEIFNNAPVGNINLYKFRMVNL